MSKSQHRTIAVACLLVILLAGVVVNVRLWKIDTHYEDIFWAWGEGERLVKGENPYARILAGNMQENHKYPTYFPLFYELSGLTQWAGLHNYEPWIAFWRVIFLAFNLAIAAALFTLIYPRGQLIAAAFAACFWLFNRWTLYVSQVAHLDFIPIFLLIVSLSLFRKHRWVSLLLYSLSLGIKQIGIFVAPLYLIWTWQAVEVKSDRLKQTLLAALVIASVPLATSLPFIAWNAEGLVKSVLFSVTREPADDLRLASLDAWMGWLGWPGRLPMFALLVLTYVLAWRRKVGLYTGPLLVMATFVSFNTVFFRQYVAWIVPLLPLVLCDLWDAADRKATGQ